MKVISVAILMFVAAFGYTESRPNIIMFISDDHGWADSGVYGNSDVSTPNMDRLAKDGMRFTHAFANTPLCSPSRCVIGTGLHPFRNGGHLFGSRIKSKTVTMPQYFKELGYHTVHMGKFHHSPKKQFPYDVVSRDARDGVKVLAEYDKKKPLLLIVCSHPPHTPWIKNTTYKPETLRLPPNFVDTPATRESLADYYSDVALMDAMLGNLMDAIDVHGYRDNSLLIYTSDQGANWPFAKWCVYDAGLRVPFIVRWRGVVKPGLTSDAFLDLSDLLPTAIAAAGGTPPTELDGRSILPILRGETASHRDVVFGTHTGNNNGGPGVGNQSPARTVRTKNFRYVLNLNSARPFDTHITGTRPSSPHYLAFWDEWVQRAKTDVAAKRIVDAYRKRPVHELYNIDKDPYERNNLAMNPEYKDILASCQKLLRDWREQQNDKVPVKQPSRAASRGGN